MNKIFKVTVITTLLAFSCTKTIEKPTITIEKYTTQLIIMNGVINKILNEPDPKKMKIMADSIESSRAVDCIPITEECNMYYTVINKTVNLTKDGTITDDQRMELFKMRNDFHKEVKLGELKIREIWKNYEQSLPKPATAPAPTETLP